MKNKLKETKLKSALGLTGQLFGRLACLGAVVLTCSRALAQNLFVGDGGGGRILKFTWDGVQSIFASGLTSLALACDGSGNLFVADYGGSILKFTPDGVHTTFASG